MNSLPETPSFRSVIRVARNHTCTSSLRCRTWDPFFKIRSLFKCRTAVSSSTSIFGLVWLSGLTFSCARNSPIVWRRQISMSKIPRQMW
jgi:hypothetical protein